MAANAHQPRPSSPSPDTVPARALGPGSMQRCLSTPSTTSHGSASGSDARDSFGPSSRQSSMTFTSSGSSRLSDASILSNSSNSNPNNRATIHIEKPRKSRGYVRPQGTDFAASARQRESVLSLGSIAHLQYYFARTGLLDGKGAQLQRLRKKQRARPATLDLSMLRADTPSPRLSLMSPKQPGDSPSGSLGSSPDLVPAGILAGSVVASPIEDPDGDMDAAPDEQFFLEEYDDPDPDMPPPTTSTYNHREKPLPPPPSIAELKNDLATALDNAARTLQEASIADGTSTPSSPATPTKTDSPGANKAQPPGWYEIQGLNILDVVTLAIRAAKMYYTAHPHPDRLDAVKPEKELRAELLAVMDALRKSASRQWANGLKPEEHKTMTDWIASVRDTLAREAAVEEEERNKRKDWTWLRGDWTGRETEREIEFLKAMFLAPHAPLVEEAPPTVQRKISGGATAANRSASRDRTTEKEEKRRSIVSVPDEEPLPEYTPAADCEEDGPTAFLAHFKNGIRLVRLHNAAVRASRRRFGAIGTYHKDTAVPYRAAENIRFWAKAAELRWEVFLKLDALAVVQGSGGKATWIDFEKAILQWSKKVREEIAGEMED